MYRCESWTIKKAECQRIDAFELWYWRRLLRVPWTASRANQSILKDINPDYSLEVLMLRKTERRGWQRMRQLDGITDSTQWSWANSGRQWKTGKLGMLQSMGLQRVGDDLATEQEQQQKPERVSPWNLVTYWWHYLVFKRNEQLPGKGGLGRNGKISCPFQRKEKL